MNAKKLLWLAVTAAVLGALAYWSKREPGDGTPADAASGALVLSQLDHPDVLNRVAAIELQTLTSTVRVVRVEERWVAPDRFNYPLRFERVREFLMKLAGLKVGQSIPTDGRSIAELNLVSPLDEGATTNSGLYIELQDETGEKLAELVVGKERMTPSADDSPYGGLPGGRYVRAGDRVSLVTETFMNLPSQAMDWVDRQVMNVPAADIASIRLTTADGDILKLDRPQEGGDFVLEGLKTKEELDAAKVSALADTLNWLAMSDVADPQRPDVDIGLDRPTVFEAATREGLVYTLKAGKNREGSSDRYARLSVAYRAPAGTEESAETRQKADTLNAGVAPWIYLFPDYKLNGVTGRRADFLKKPAAQPAGEPKAKP